MPRSPRIVIPNIPVHVTQRGNRQFNIFHEDADKEFYMKRFMFYKKKFKVKLYAWCLMSNHVHFVLEPLRKNSLYKLFLCLNTSYVAYYNKKYNISGKLFGNRFFSCLLDNEHLYNTIRYVELNPVRVKMTSRVDEYEWSSAQEHLGKRNQFYLSRLPNFMQSLNNNWEAYLMEGLLTIKQDIQGAFSRIRSATISNLPLGNENFLKMIERITGLKLLSKKFYST
jgi:putative transposase